MILVAPAPCFLRGYAALGIIL